MSAGAALHASNEDDVHASAGSAEAALEQSRPPKKRRHISISLPAARDKAADSPATPQDHSAARYLPAVTDAGRDAEENAGRRGSRRKQGASQEGEQFGMGLSSSSKVGSQEAQVAEPQGPPASSPGLKVKLKRQKLQANV